MNDVIIQQIPASVTSREVAIKEHTKLIVSNEFQETKNEYGVNSNGTSIDTGKGESAATMSKVEIAEFTKLTTMNMYGPNKPYKNPE